MLKRNIIIALVLFYMNTHSQDIAFTQSFMVPETINPSFYTKINNGMDLILMLTLNTCFLMTGIQILIVVLELVL